MASSAALAEGDMELQDRLPNEIERAELLREGKIQSQRDQPDSRCTSLCRLSLLAVILATLLVLCAILISRDKGGSLIKKNKTSEEAVRCWQPSLDLRHEMQLPAAIRNQSISLMQGLAFQPENKLLYEGHTQGMRVYSIDQNGLKMIKNHSYNLKTDFPKIPAKPPLSVTHVGGLAWDRVNSVVWLSTRNNYSKSNTHVGALMAVDAESLEPKKSDPSGPYDDNSYDWVAIDNDNCIGYAGAFSKIKLIKRFDTNKILEAMSDLPLNLPEQYSSTGLMYIQSGTIGPDGELMLIGDDYRTTLYSINVETGNLISTQALFIGNEVDGLAYISFLDVLLVGLNRKAHDNAKQESILRLQPYFGVKTERKFCALASWKPDELKESGISGKQE